MLGGPIQGVSASSATDRSALRVNNITAGSFHHRAAELHTFINLSGAEP
jgi:hypothetical protein